MEWKDITLGMFAQIQAITKSQDEDLTKKIELYAVLTGKDMSVVRDLPLGEFLEAYKKELSFLNDEMPQVVPKYWEHKGVRYHISTEVEKIKAGQYIDLKEYMKEYQETGNMSKVIAVLCYDGVYDGSTHKQRADLFNSYMPITVAYPLSVFFFELWSAWSEVSLQYSNQLLKQIREDLPENMAG